MLYDVIHRTRYEYDTEVSVSHHVVRAAPRELPRQRVLAHTLEVRPKPAVLSTRTDFFGNATTFLTVEGAHRQLEITARSRVELDVPARAEPAHSAAWETVHELARTENEAAREASQFVFDSPLIPRRPVFFDYAQPSFPPGRPLLEGLLDLTARIHADFKFDPKATTVATSLEQVFQERRGVCQDFAQLQIACLRSLGLPARYVSGYLETLPPPGRPKLVGADASHAWVQAWCGEAGWVDLDPTNNCLPGDRHITVAWGRDFSDVSPVRGVVVGGGRHELSVAVDVAPVVRQP